MAHVVATLHPQAILQAAASMAFVTDSNQPSTAYPTASGAASEVPPHASLWGGWGGTSPAGVPTAKAHLKSHPKTVRL